jgi:hypothetical protein
MWLLLVVFSCARSLDVDVVVPVGPNDMKRFTALVKTCEPVFAHGDFVRATVVADEMYADKYRAIVRVYGSDIWQVMDEGDLIPAYKRTPVLRHPNGWVRQMDVKLHYLALRGAPIVVVMDADSLCASSNGWLRYRKLLMDKIPLCLEKTVYNPPYGNAIATARTLNIGHIDVGKGLMGWTPQVLSRPAFQGVLAREPGLLGVLKAAWRTRDCKITTRCWTEYYVYQWLLDKHNLTDSVHRVVSTHIDFSAGEKVDTRCPHARVRTKQFLSNSLRCDGGDCAPFLMIDDHDPRFSPDRVSMMISETHR